MKTLLKLCIPLLALLTPGFGQEPKTALIKDTPAAESREQTVTTGSAKEPAPKVQPKALPPLSPTLGEIARAARAAHAAAAKAQMVLDPDADIITVTNPSEKTAAVTNATADPGPRAVPRMWCQQNALLCESGPLPDAFRPPVILFDHTRFETWSRAFGGVGWRALVRVKLLLDHSLRPSLLSDGLMLRLELDLAEFTDSDYRNVLDSLYDPQIALGHAYSLPQIPRVRRYWFVARAFCSAGFS
jgi:hypothetical protein